jgi:putative Mg2+ transporter-C (MgtC) family protein
MILADAVLKVVLALIVGGLIGLERERRDIPAGIRTHMLVCGGSALITLVSILMISGTRGDATRIPAQIVSGIGFLGAGTIFRSGASVRGLTTAAGLWMVAGVGMGIAAGGTALELAAITGLIVWAVNTWIRGLEDRWVRPHHNLLLTTTRSGDVLARVFEGLAQRGVTIHQVQWVTEESGGDKGVIRVTLHLPVAAPRGELSGWLSQQHGVTQAVWE